MTWARRAHLRWGSPGKRGRITKGCNYRWTPLGGTFRCTLPGRPAAASRTRGPCRRRTWPGRITGYTAICSRRPPRRIEVCSSGMLVTRSRHTVGVLLLVMITGRARLVRAPWEQDVGTRCGLVSGSKLKRTAHGQARLVPGIDYRRFRPREYPSTILMFSKRGPCRSLGSDATSALLWCT